MQQISQQARTSIHRYSRQSARILAEKYKLHLLLTTNETHPDIEGPMPADIDKYFHRLFLLEYATGIRMATAEQAKMYLVFLA